MNDQEQQATISEDRDLIEAHTQFGAFIAPFLYTANAYAAHLALAIGLSLELYEWTALVPPSAVFVGALFWYIVLIVHGIRASLPVTGAEFAERIGEQCLRHSDLWELTGRVAKGQGGRLWRHQLNTVVAEVWRREGTAPF